MLQLADGKAFSVFEVAEILQRRAETVRLYIKNGKLKAHKIANAYFIKEQTLKDFAGRKEE